MGEILSIAPGTIKWHRSLRTSARCPICHDTREKKHIASTYNPLGNPAECDFYQCGECGSLFPFPFDVLADTHETDISADAGGSMRFYTDGTTPAYAKFYVEVGGGIDFFVRILSPFAADRSIKSFLDVGCGFGLTVDYAGRMLGWDAVGIEPGHYGRIGAQDLGLNIDHRLLGKGSKFDSSQFDLVFNTEVLEHVANQEQFLALLHSAVKPGGLLVLTTPSAEFVTPSAWNEQVLAALSPGFHSVVLSERALIGLLKRVGFTDAVVHRENDRQIVVAGKDRKVAGFDPARPYLEEYILYLEALFASGASNNIRDGSGFRLFKEYINGGRLSEAKRVLMALERFILDRYGSDFFSEANIVSLCARSANFEEYGRTSPYFIAPLLFYKGMLLLNSTDRYSQAAACFSHSAALAQEEIDRPLAYFMESASLLWTARLHQGIALLHQNKNEEALKVLSTIVQHSEQSRQSDRGLLPTYIVTRAMKESGVALLRLGRHDAALKCLDAALKRPTEVAIPGIREEIAGLISIIEFEQAMALLVKENRDEALAQFDEIIGRSQRQPVSAYIVSRSLKESGVALLQLGRPQEALDRFAAALAREEDQENAGIHNELRRLSTMAQEQASNAQLSCQ